MDVNDGSSVGADDQIRLSGADCLARILLVLIAGAAGYLTFQELAPEDRAQVDTRLESGSHLTFVLIAPTAASDQDFIEAVKGAKVNLRQRVSGAGRYLSTVGISDAWDPQAAWDIVHEFGTFDELILGRNWLNTGIKKYITDAPAEPAVPQVVITEQTVDVGSTPMAYGDLRIIRRFVGRDVVKQWAELGYPLNVDRSGAPATGDRSE